jgi:hypothetical protein
VQPSGVSRIVLVLIVLAAVAAAGCQKSTTGGERQRCKAARGDAPRCDPGLVCMSDVCVRPPPADCGEVAESLLSIELGNYAPREERAAALPAKRALCERLKISVAEAECLAKASERWSAAACVPRLYPEVEAGGCEPVVAKLRAMLGSAMAGDPSGAAMMDKVTAVIGQSCVEDHWPDALRACILALPAGDPSAFDECEKVTPPALKEKIAERVRAAMP